MVHFSVGFLDCAGGKTSDFIYRLIPVRFLKLEKFSADDEVNIYGRAVTGVFPPVNFNDRADFDAVGDAFPVSLGEGEDEWFPEEIPDFGDEGGDPGFDLSDLEKEVGENPSPRRHRQAH